jgi:hypothetical protein
LATIFKYKKGDIVMVDEFGRGVKYEILSVLNMPRGQRAEAEMCYEAQNVSTGAKKTILQEDILRMATPVDSSEDLFPAKSNRSQSAS